jgi:hypothetical protein
MKLMFHKRSHDRGMPEACQDSTTWKANRAMRCGMCGETNDDGKSPVRLPVYDGTERFVKRFSMRAAGSLPSRQASL